MGAVELRAAVYEDLPRITEIYNHYVVETPVTFDTEPFTAAERHEWFAQFDVLGRYRLWVAVESGAVAGYAGTMRFRAKPAYHPSVETTIYLAPERTARGLGRRLYTALFDAIAGEDIHRLLAGITLPNPASLKLHEHFGFEPIGTYSEVGRKLGRYWDVHWMEKRL